MADIELETPDPIAALDDKSISVRAAACRDLSKSGTVEDLARLAQAAQHDKSPAVRLGTAAAASDILSRLRLPPQSDSLDAEGRKAVLELFKRVDPRLNPGVFSVFACLDLEAGLSRVRIGLRDPRGEVRMGAAVGLMRLCTSWARAGDSELRSAVVEMLKDRRLRPDAVAEVARVCMASGITEALPVLERLDVGGVHQDLVEVAISKLEAATSRPVGVWMSDGRDAGEIRPVALAAPKLLVVGDAGAAVLVDGQWSSLELSASSWRAMHYRRAGSQSPGPTLQVDGTTYYAVEDAELIDAIDTVLPAERLAFADPVAQAIGHLARSLAERLGDAPVDSRACGLLWASIGDAQSARDAFESGVGKRKAPADLRYLHGAALMASGDADGAKAVWTECVAKARRKGDWFVGAARDGLKS